MDPMRAKVAPGHSVKRPFVLVVVLVLVLDPRACFEDEDEQEDDLARA